MDLSAFAKDKFVVKDWLNATFRQPEAQANPENYASSLVMKLQLAIYEISSSLESTSGSVVQSLPRLLRDVELLSQEVSHFQSKLQNVEHEVGKVERDTTHSMDHLIKLDTIKTKLKATSKALQEADNWTTLMADIEELFESADLLALSQRLNSLKQSLDLLSHVTDYSDRLLQLDGLRNRLEALASPHLVAAVSANDAAKAKNLVQVFTNMDRMEQLLHYYTKCRRGVILQQWKEQFELEDSGNILEMVNRFYDLLLQDLQEQTKWYGTVFHEHSSAYSSNTLLPIYTQALSALDPSPLYGVESLIKKPAASEGLYLLQQLKSSSDRLAHGVEAHIKDVGPIEDEVLFHFGESLYQLFRLLVSNKYNQLSSQSLVEQFPAIKGVDQREDAIDSINQLKQAQSKINSLVESSFSSCLSLTNGCGLHFLLEAWNKFLIQHLQLYKGVLECLRNVQQSGDDSLHAALLLLQTLGELLIVLEENDAVLATQFKSCNRRLKEAAAPLQRYTILYLEPNVRQRLEAVFVDLEQNPSHSLLKPTISAALELNVDVQSCIFETLMSPIRRELALLGSSEWASIISGSGLTEDLPEFGLAPMEYITQVGQYMMMLPQHLEPFILQENRGLGRALAEQVFPHAQTDVLLVQPGQHSHSAADFLLGCVAKASAAALSEAVLRIPTLGAKAAKQVAADIDYLGNIFEDLGLALPINLSSMRDLLRAAALSILNSDVSHYKAACDGKAHRMVAAVRTMCNLPSSD